MLLKDEIFKRDNITLLAVIAIAALSICLAQAWLPPSLDPESIYSLLPFLRTLHGDLGIYGLRFFLISLLFGLIPFLVLTLLGLRPAEVGIRRPRLRFYLWLVLACAGCGLGFLTYLASDLASYYPYSKTIPALLKQGQIAWLFFHPCLYLFFYYLPWEFFFRGFLIFPLLKTVDSSWPADMRLNSIRFLVLSFQTIPSAFFHIGHPLLELLSAIPAGFFFGLLAFKTRSILPGLIFHACLGISLDLLILLEALKG